MAALAASAPPTTLIATPTADFTAPTSARGRAALSTPAARNAAPLAAAARQRGLARPARRAPSGAARAASVASADTEVADLQAQFGKEDVTVEAGEGGLPRVTLRSESGSVVEVYLYGAVTTSWRLPAGEDLLFVRPDAVFTGQKPISGGIPHCFPQFGPGAMQQHGFARNVSWTIASTTSGQPGVVLRLVPSEYTRAMWDHDFELEYQVDLLGAGDELATRLTVRNTGSSPFDFTAALHSYFRAEAERATVRGLTGCSFLNKDPDPKNPIPGQEDRPADAFGVARPLRHRELVGFPGFVDCMYTGVPDTLVLDSGLQHDLTLSATGWSDAVLWNPHLTMEACYKDFVCVENAQLEKVVVNPSESWTASQSLKASKK
eukprot:SM000161S02432  [mRNA]  locus=s161:151967:155206:- [translate_table: standard]